MLTHKLLAGTGISNMPSYWIATLGGTGNDVAFSVAIDSSGNIIVAGYTTSSGSGGSDFLIAKYNSSGTLQWQKTLGGTGMDEARSVAIDSSGNIIVAGYTTSSGSGGSDFLIAKYNSSGTLQWQKTLGGTLSDVAFSVAIDSSGNIIVAGYTASSGSGGNVVLIAKYNSSGTLQWQKTLGGTGNEIVYSFAIDSSDNIIVAGYIDDSTGSIDILIAKYNSSGSLLWQKTLIGTGSDNAQSVAIDSLDNIIVAGYITYSNSNDFLIAKYNSSGSLLWQKALGGRGNDQAYSVAIDSLDNIIIAGSTDYDFLIAKYNSSGSLLWQKTLGGGGLGNNEFAYSVAIDSSNNIIVAGTSSGSGGSDFLIAKYNSSGTLLWQKTLGGTGSDVAYSVAIDSSNNIIVGGWTTSSGYGSNDVLISKYNSSGSLLWQKTLGGTGNDYARSVAIDSSDNIIVAGSTDSSGSGGNDVLIAKYNPEVVSDGTYGAFIIQTSSLAYQASSLSTGTPILTQITPTLTQSTPTLTQSISTLTETFTRFL